MICPRCQQSVRDGARFCDSCGLSIGSIASANQSAEVLAETVKVVDPLIGQVIDAKYRLIEQLGKGGMGVVYRAERVLVGDEVALKILRGELVAEEESVERFRREARAAAKLRHPNIVTIYDYGEARGADAPAYIVMELLDGESLRDLLRREGSLQPDRAINLMRGICAGIGLAHRRQIVHRDIKPDNMILLPPDEEEGREHETVKVVDFGIAKLRDAASGGTLTRKGFQPGTVFYMSPEQCRGDALDARSDVYSLGALLYEMLAGTPPFVAESHTGVISKHLFDPPPPLSKERNVSASLEAVVMRALAKVPEERQDDASALARELQDAERQEREARQREEEERQREEEERRRVAADRQRTEEARQREDEERRRQSEEEHRHQSETMTVPTEPARGRSDRGPLRRPETTPALTVSGVTEPASRERANFGLTDPVSAASLGLEDVQRPKTSRKVWVIAGVLGALVLAIVLSIKLFPSGSSTVATEGTANPSKSASSSGAAPPNYKVVGNPLRTDRDVFKVALSPNGKTLISTGGTSSSPTAPISDFFDIDGSSLAFSPNGELLAVGQADGTIILKDPTDLSHKIEWHEHRDYVFFVGFSSDGKKLVSASGDKTLRVWNTDTKLQEHQLEIGPDELIVTADPSRMRVAIFNPQRGLVRLRSITDSVAMGELAKRGPDAKSGEFNPPVTAGAFSPNGELLALGKGDGKIEIWSVPAGMLVREYQSPRPGEVGSVLFSPDGQFLAIGLYNGDIELRATSSDTPLQTLKGHARVVRTMSFSSDGRTLASGAEDKTIRLWQNEEIGK